MSNCFFKLNRQNYHVHSDLNMIIWAMFRHTVGLSYGGRYMPALAVSIAGLPLFWPPPVISIFITF